MKIGRLGFGRQALGIGLAIGLLAGCGAQNATTDAMPLATTAQSPAHQASSSNALLYVNRYSKYVDMLTYPGLKRVGSFTYLDKIPFGQPCPDDLTGNIYFPGYDAQGNSELLEYVDGGITPIGSLKPPTGYSAVNCAVDPTTGNIAVALGTNARTKGYIGIYAPGSKNPMKYQYPNLPWYASCRYDDSGNLFVLGATTFQLLFLELPKGGSKLTKLSLHLKAYIFAFPVLWDGSYITVETENEENGILTIFRIAVSGSSAKVVGKTELHGAGGALWIQDANTVISGRFPRHIRGRKDIAFYNYPEGRLRSIFGGLRYRENQVVGLAVATPPSGSRIRK